MNPTDPIREVISEFDQYLSRSIRRSETTPLRELRTGVAWELRHYIVDQLYIELHGMSMIAAAYKGLL